MKKMEFLCGSTKNLTSFNNLNRKSCLLKMGVFCGSFQGALPCSSSNWTREVPVDKRWRFPSSQRFHSIQDVSYALQVIGSEKFLLYKRCRFPVAYSGSKLCSSRNFTEAEQFLHVKMEFFCSSNKNLTSFK